MQRTSWIAFPKLLPAADTNTGLSDRGQTISGPNGRPVLRSRPRPFHAAAYVSMPARPTRPAPTIADLSYQFRQGLADLRRGRRSSSAGSASPTSRKICAGWPSRPAPSANRPRRRCAAFFCCPFACHHAARIRDASRCGGRIFHRHHRPVTAGFTSLPYTFQLTITCWSLKLLPHETQDMLLPAYARSNVPTCQLLQPLLACVKQFTVWLHSESPLFRGAGTFSPVLPMIPLPPCRPMITRIFRRTLARAAPATAPASPSRSSKSRHRRFREELERAGHSAQGGIDGAH